MTPAGYGDVSFAHTDDFSDGSVQNWFIGFRNSPAAPANVATGGPAGAGDRFLEYTSNGGDSIASRMIIFNRRAQWGGDYLSLGVAFVQFDVRNAGPAPLQLRIAFSNGVGEFDTWFAATTPVRVPADNSWRTVCFPIATGGYTRIQGGASYEAVMGAVEGFRILSSAAPAFRGDALAATIGIDNIRALPALPLPDVSIAGLSRAEVHIEWVGVPGVRYQIQRSTSLRPDEWDEVGDPQDGDGTPESVAVPMTAAREFYRVLATRSPPAA